ncbi:tyrosine-type recombinase/integrase, partial [Campylobacter lanienae]|uniref:tyrosine-type recombinase/integrase n=1 Tax=Campylobacter lanienae TaxID=75658 RepID=UPI000BB41489
PAIGNKDIKEIKYEDLVEILNNIFNPNNPNKSRLETIYRLISVMKNVFAIAIKSRYISYDPTFGLRDEYPSLASFYLKNNIDSRLPSLIDLDMIKEFIIDLKMDNKLDTQTKRAIYLQILCVNRPINTVSARWEHIDLDKAIWTIPASEMKMRVTHEIPLSKYMIKILNAQKLFCYDLKGYVFPALNANGHLHRDTISKAIRNLGGKNRYSGIATSHGFRATFRTICSKNKAELLNLGISEEVIESVLAHKELNAVKRSYEREKATIEQKAKLLEWYGDYLNSIEPLGI